MASLVTFTAVSAEFPSTNFPDLTTINPTERRHVLAFDDTTEESCAWTWTAPVGVTAPLTADVFFVMATATTGTVAFGVSIEAINPDVDTVNLVVATDYDTENVGTAQTVPGTVGFLGSQTITLTNDDGITDGYGVRIKLAGKTTGTATGDALVTALAIRDSAT